MLVHLPGITDLANLAVAHNDNAVRHGQGFLLVVGDIYEGDAQILLQFLDDNTQAYPDLGVQGAQRFVQQQHIRLDGDGAPQAYTLLLPATELRRVVVPPGTQPQQLQDLIHPFIDQFLRHLAHFQAESGVFPYGHVGKKGVGLEDNAEIPFLGDHVVDHLAIVNDIARGHLFEPRDEPQQGCFATPAGTEKTDELSRFDLQIDIVHRYQ